MSVFSSGVDTLYVRCIRQADGVRYVLRESIQVDGSWTSRDLLDLGSDPGDVIEYPGGRGYYFKSEVEDALENGGVVYTAEELERAFLPFLRGDIRRIVEMFAHRQPSARGSQGRRVTDDELAELHLGLHGFDKRRLHFLKFGRIDCGDLDARPWKFLRVLLKRSRDEVEHIIEGMESQLRPHELRNYLYTAFHLESYFRGHLLKDHPIALDPEKLDACFLEEVCRLNSDREFFAGVGNRDSGTLHPFLRKYVTLFFDHDFVAQRIDPSFYREFMNRRRAHGRVLAVRAAMPLENALLLLRIAEEEFRCMTRTQLTRRYRKIAKRVHPDGGGEHEEFIQITEAYEVLRCRLP
ncbi:MAG: J domain-containing protein [Syntrophobacteraceae bacterium]|nr:J domain-containing protein [Syntrophobacteraceae bacterium]